MDTRRKEKLKSYLTLITQGLDPDKIVGLAAPGLEGLEAAGGEAAHARLGAEAVARNIEPRDEDLAGLEAIILPKLRPAEFIIDGKFESAHELWRHLSADAAIRARLEKAIPSIGRIELPGHRSLPYGGTGFIVGDGLVMTNRHVAAIFATGLGDRRLSFKTGAKAGLNLGRERSGPEGETLEVRRVVMIHPYWDMAIVSVDGLPAGHEPLRLSLAEPEDIRFREIAMIGYPAFDPRNDPTEQDDVFKGEYGVKRLQPGLLQGRAPTDSFGKEVDAAAHDCSTLGGNSGSAVIDLATGEVLALHFGGRFHEKNFGVPATELAKDGRVVDAGVSFAGEAPGGDPAWRDWWTRADADETADAGGDRPDPAPTPGAKLPQSSTMLQAAQSGAVTIEIPLRITVSLGAPPTQAIEAPLGDFTEAMVEPWHDDDYTRDGYDKNFLGVLLPLPKAADKRLLAKTFDGDTVLHYQNFSIAMHAARRLALFTASNVTAEPDLRRPDRRRKYGRKDLTGLGKNDREKWFPDPRLDAKHQLPDAFFTKDRQAFDKGHIVRRDDVCWGETYDELRRANGDTFHVTNCSPQVKGYNQSAQGVDNWGDLENHVLASAKMERLCVFAGPILDRSDTMFIGVGEDGETIRARIPSRYWKVIVAPTSDGLAAYGFVLEQDLGDVDFEFIVPENFAPFMYPISDIEEWTGVRFGEDVLSADQFDSVRGAETAFAAGARRRRRTAA